MRMNHFIYLLLMLPVLLSSFSIDSSVELYHSDHLISGDQNAIARYQDYIYVAGEGGLGIYRQDDDEIILVRNMNSDFPSMWSVFVQDNKLFTIPIRLRSSYSQVSRYDLSDPGNPVLEESLDWYRCDICFFDNGLLYSHEVVGDEFLRCHVLNPLDFTDEIACYTIPYEYCSLVYAGDSKCVVLEIDGDDYISHVFDISDPLNIHEAFSLPIGSICVDRKYLFMSEEGNEYLLFVAYAEYASFYDITNHEEPVELWRHENWTVNAVIDDNNVAHILSRYEMVGLDISDLTQPEQVYQVEMYRAWDNECAGNNIITAGRFLTVHELNGNDLIDIAQAPLDGTLDYNDCNGDFLYLGTFYQALVQLDIRNPVPPVPFQRIIMEPDGYSGAWMSCTGNTLAFQYYVHEGESGHLETSINRQAVDGELTEIAHFDYNHNALPYLRNDNELIMGEEGELQRYAVSDDGIELIESIDIPQCAIYAIAHRGDYLYITDSYQIFVVYAPEESTMELVNTIGTVYADLPCFEFIDDFMIVGGLFYGEQTSIFNISDPADPVYLYGLNPIGPMGIDEENELLFVGYYECSVYDLAPLLESGNEPDSIASFTTSDSFTGFYPLGNNEMVCVNRTGVEYIEYSHVGIDDDNAPKVTALSLTNYPNPFNPETTIRFDIPGRAQTRLSIYNIRGQLVKTLVDQPMDTGEHFAVWNGTDTSDKPVSSGVYLYRLESGEHVVTKRMLLMK